MSIRNAALALYVLCVLVLFLPAGYRNQPGPVDDLGRIGLGMSVGALWVAAGPSRGKGRQ